MALIETVPPEKAQSVVKEAYDMFMKNFGLIPKPMEMLSVSPTLFELMLKRIQYLSSHPTLSFPLLAHIRYIVAHNLDYKFCMDFNRHILKKQGLSEEDIRNMVSDPSKSLLEEKEKTLLEFVIRAVRSPASITEQDMANLKDWGWEDRDIVDALGQGVSMIDHSIMMQVFQMDQNCVMNA